MTNLAFPLVLIGYANGLGVYEAFSSKVSSLLNTLDEYRVIAIDDHRGFCLKYFADRLVRTEIGRTSLRDQESVVRQCSHALYFWDGHELSSYIHLSLLHKLKTRIVPIKATRVVNLERGEEFDVYIGRRGLWGNPFAIGQDGSREEVIEKFREYFFETLMQQGPTRAGIHGLRGLRLGCHCKPYACHGDIIAEYLNTLPQVDAEETP